RTEDSKRADLLTGSFERCDDRRLCLVPFEVGEEDVAPEPLLEGPGFDLAEVHASLGELLEDAEQGARDVGQAPENDRRLPGTFLSGFACRLAGQPDEASFVFGHVFHPSLENLTPVELGGEAVAECRPGTCRLGDETDGVSGAVCRNHDSIWQLLADEVRALRVCLGVR